ncbi:MAG: glycosyltransferase family 4 protein [Nitrososphaerales archaeon]
MKIAQVNVYFYPHMVGGAEWYVYNISRALVRLGHEVDVITSVSYNGEEIEEPTEVEGVKIHRLPLNLNLSYRAKVWSGLKEELMNGDYDIIHTYDYAQPHTFTALNVGGDLDIPVALTVFDIHSLIPRPFWKKLPMRIFDRFFASTVLEMASIVLVRAPNLIPSLLKMGLPQERIRVTPSGILDEALNHFDGYEFLTRHSIEGRPVILYLGRLHPMKGPQYLLKAAPKIIEQHPNAHLVFVGPEQDGYADRLREMSERLGVSRHVSLLEPIYDFEEKMNAYASCDIFTLPSGYEGTSQAVFEAMAQSRPIVATDRGGIPFQVEDGREGLLVKYGDVEGFAEAVLRLLKDRELASQLGSNAREKVKRFTYSLLAKDLESIFLSLLESHTNHS